MNLQEQILRIYEVMGITDKDFNMKEIIFDMINYFVKGADLYEHEGSLWLIFTDEKKWVIELTNNGKLWYNHDFFKSFFKYLSLDVLENQDYITEWVKDTIENRVKNTRYLGLLNTQRVEDTIKNGVKRISGHDLRQYDNVEDTIQNGMKIGDIKND